MRNVIHPDVWVNALFVDYTPNMVGEYTPKYPEYPNWIITDMRFPNEMEAVKNRGGITIRVNSNFQRFTDGSYMVKNKTFFKEYNHVSETALNDAKFDYVIDNNGSIEDLILKVKEILQKEKLI